MFPLDLIVPTTSPEAGVRVTYTQSENECPELRFGELPKGSLPEEYCAWTDMSAGTIT